MTVAALPGPWITHPRPAPGASLRLFCLPYAGTGASAFKTWPAELPRTIEVCPIQLPGREDRIAEAPWTSLPQVVDAVAAALRSAVDRPFALFGHSMGALISFELARALRARGCPPACVIVSGHRAPQLAPRHAPLHQLPDDTLREELRRLQGNQPSLLDHAELLAVMLPAIRADLRLCETYTYRPGEPLPCPIIAFGGADDPEVSLQELTAWRDQTRSTFTPHLLPGGHFFLHTARAEVLRLIAGALA